MASLVRPKGKKAPDYWVIEWSDGGQRRYTTLGRMSREEAEQALEEFKARQRLGLDPSPAPSPTSPTTLRLDTVFREIYEPLIERKSEPTQLVELRCMGHFLRLWPGIKVEQITPLKMEQYKSRRLKEGVVSATINQELGVLRRALRAAEEFGYLPDGAPTIKRLKRNDQREPVYLNIEQALRLQAELIRRARDPNHTYPAVIATLMALHTGMRKGEVLTREVADLDWDRGSHGVLHVGSKPGVQWYVKTRRQRVVPLTELLAEEIRTFLTWRGDDPGWLFRRGKQGRLYKIAEAAWRLCVNGPKTVQELAAGTEHLRHLGNPDQPWSYYVARAIQKNRKMFRDFGFGQWIGQASYAPAPPPRLQSFTATLRSACKASGVPRLHQHALRHCWATLAFAGGMDIRTVQELGGWTTPHVPLTIYAHVCSETALLAVDKFPLGRITKDD